MKKILPIIAITSLFALAGLGCIKISGTSSGETGGVWKTADQGETWEQKVSYPTAEGVGKIGQISVQTLAIDPSDHLAIYAGTAADGLLYTYDGAETWKSAKQLDTGSVSSVTINPENKCEIYAASRNKVYRSIDCNRTFEQAYYETRASVNITDVEVDWYNTAVVYAATSEGDLIKSQDAGASWSPVYRFDGAINDFMVDPFDSRMLYAATENKGFWKSSDGGASWNNFDEVLKEFKNSKDVYFVAADRTSQNTVIIVTKYGLIRTLDGGNTWSAIDLLTPPSEATITSIALNPREGNEIYYTTASTIYKSIDGGASWITKKVPAAERAASAIIVDSENNKVIYLGVKEVAKQGY
ncbi:MAG: YCF48-related protein [Patescibacteria group bacterium]|nr:YCF48-related protein [Patescibacteria group bacterium]